MKIKYVKSFLIFTLSFTLLLQLSGCLSYSFTGVSTNATSMSVVNFFNDSEGGPANIADNFTNQLKDYFLQNTNLNIYQNDGELQFEGTIVSYLLSPVSPQAGRGDPRQELAAQTRLTINIKVTFTNLLDEKASFTNKNFSFYQDFNNDLNFASIEEQLINTIFEQIILSIFNDTVANW
jgi:hypothetical protein